MIGHCSFFRFFNFLLTFLPWILINFCLFFLLLLLFLCLFVFLLFCLLLLFISLFLLSFHLFFLFLYLFFLPLRLLLFLLLSLLFLPLSLLLLFLTLLFLLLFLLFLLLLLLFLILLLFSTISIPLYILICLCQHFLLFTLFTFWTLTHHSRRSIIHHRSICWLYRCITWCRFTLICLFWQFILPMILQFLPNNSLWMTLTLKRSILLIFSMTSYSFHHHLSWILCHLNCILMHLHMFLTYCLKWLFFIRLHHTLNLLCCLGLLLWWLSSY